MFSRQPFDQPVHRRHAPGLDVAEILLGPAADLALEIIAGLAVIAEPGGVGIDPVQLRDRRVHRVEISGPLGRGDFGKGGLPEDPPLDHLHHVEGGADHRLVEAQAERLGDREALRAQGGDHPIFAVDRVRAGQQFARRLAAQHIGARSGVLSL